MSEFPSDWDEYRKVITVACTKTVSVSNGMAVTYLYESAKDVLKWLDVNVSEYVKTVMSVGNLVHLDDKDFNEVIADNDFIPFSAYDLEQFMAEKDFHGKD